jgi:hypothetical protein
MANNELTFTRGEIPFWLGGGGKLTISVPGLNFADPLPRGAREPIQVRFGAQGDQKFIFGHGLTPKMSVRAGSHFVLRPIWDASEKEDREVLKAFGLQDHLERHPDEVILWFESGFTGEASLGGEFQYSLLTGSITMEAGGEARYRLLRPGPAAAPAGRLLANCFAGIRLPANITEPPRPGEIIALEYNGRVALGAKLGLGYELTGSPSFNIGQLRLSERYKLAVLSGVQLGASIAGRFSIEVSAPTEDAGPTWARVVLRKSKTQGLCIAADATIDFQGNLKGLPDSPNEFLGAALGVNAKNWMNFLAEVREWANFEMLEKNLDNLARDFISEWLGRGFDALKKIDEFNAFLASVHQTVEIYDTLEDRAITLFDGYFNRLGLLTEKLEDLLQLTSWERFWGALDPDLWDIVNQLTDGDPLGWMIGQVLVRLPDGSRVEVDSLEELKKRAQKTLSLVQDSTHEEIRKLIALAKQKFGLDIFIQRLKEVDSWQELQALAGQRAGFFVERLLGKAVDALGKSELKEAFDRVHAALTYVDDFESRMYAKLLQAAKSAFHCNLHAEYNRTADRGALVDILINLTTDEGKELMRAAGNGNFVPALAARNPDLVRIKGALLTSRLAREASFNINIEGWHFKRNYSGFDRVVVETEQRVQPSGNGGIIIYTTLEARREKERRRNHERMFTSFLVRFLGESAGKVGSGAAAFDVRNRQYMIDVLTGAAATYQVLLEDRHTSREELQYYLSFARQIGLDRVGVTLDALEQVLPAKTVEGKTDFGNVSADYRVRYNKRTLRRMLDVRIDEQVASLIRSVMRRIVLGNYVQSRHRAHLSPIGWAYWTEGVHAYWRREGANFTNHSTINFRPDASPFEGLAPDSGEISLNRTQSLVVNTLCLIEEHMIAGIRKLYDVFRREDAISPRDLERAVSDIGTALGYFDDFDEDTNTMFAIFDQLVQLVDRSPDVRSSSLQLTSEIESADSAQPLRVTKVFTSDAQPAY